MNHVSNKYRRRSWEAKDAGSFRLAGGTRESRAIFRKKRESNNFYMGLVIALAFLSLAFYSVPRFHSTLLLKVVVEEPIIITPPATEPLRKMAKPEPVKIPIASEEDDVPEDLEIDYAIFEPQDIEDVAPPEPDEAEEETVYIPLWKLERKPEIITRIVPEYPKLARMAGITGTVICEIAIGKTGKVEDAKVVKSVAMLDNAALAAVKQWVFSPGMQRDHPVRVKMSVPVQFTLR